ncbi:Ribosome biogenesis protein [Recurvomyces mirabilis]|uniref:Ribosome biogenesis protein n=2 Tax=Recurvomyces mirabilis TaxID=574656 RepID=A0AAE0WSW6_9PEZI|nr:Ribosome biogenesis protein [Recurvomyces mirabilis]
MGDDFPEAVLKQFQSWALNLLIRKVPGAKSTRGLLEYKDKAFGRKTFRYLTPPLNTTPELLEDSNLLYSASFHFLARPEDLETQVANLLRRRAERSKTGRPLLVWEPAPPYCNSRTRTAHLEMCKRVDVFSPNHLELISLFEDHEHIEQPFDRKQVERYARCFLDSSLEESQAGAKIVIRAGEHGCLFMSNMDEPTWLPTFYDSTSVKIVDATGAGNAFLGALAITLRRTNDLKESAIYGSVAASFALEQIGLPTTSIRRGKEVWNGVEFTARLMEYRLTLVN